MHHQESIRDSNPCSAAAHSAPSNQSYTPSEGAMDNSQGESPVVVTNECVRRILRAKARATLGSGGEDRNCWPPILWEMSCLLPPSAHGLGSSFKGPADEQRGGDEESPELSVPEEHSFCQALCLGSTRGRVMRPHPSPTQGKSQFGREASQRRQSPRR